MRNSLTYETAPEYYKSKAYSFVGGLYDMWKNNGNCTHYAYARSCELAGKNIKGELMDWFPNASQWYNNARWSKGDKPKVGAIACYGGNGTAGHVEIVEQVNPDGSYVVSHSGWRSYIYRVSTRNLRLGDKLDNVAGYLMGFIYNPYINETTPTELEIASDNITTDQAIDKMAHDVISGMYGNGATNRKNNLYKTIQKRVNELMRGDK